MATAPSKSLVDHCPRTKSEIVSDTLAKGVMFALVLTVVGRVIGFVRGIFFCRLMTDQQLGQWSMVWSFLMLLAPLAVLGLPGCLGRYVEHYRQRGQMGALISRIAAVSGAMTLLLTASIFAFPDWYSWVVFRETDHTAIIFLLGTALVFVSLLNFLMSLMESLRQVRVVTLMRFVMGIVFAAVSCGLLLVWEDGTSAATVGYAVSCLIASLPAVWFLWKYRDGFADDGERLTHTALWRRVAPFAIWLWWSNLFNNLFEVTDRYMLIHWSPVEAVIAQGYVGQYHSGRVIPLLLVSIAAMLGGLLMPYMSAAWEKGNQAHARIQLHWTIKLLSIVFTAGGLLVLLFSPYLFETILEGRYNDGLAVLPLTFVYCTWFGLFTVGQDYLWVVEKGKLAFIAVAIGLAANIALNLLLIPYFGLWGAVIATAIANAINVSLIYGFNHLAGCHNDVGVWFCALLPLVLLLPMAWAVVVLAVVAVAGFRTNFIFSVEEKSELGPILRTASQKVLAWVNRA